MDDVPCACKGNTGRAHPQCLAQWAKFKNITHCEICNQEFVGLDLENVVLAPNLTSQREQMQQAASRQSELNVLRVQLEVCVSEALKNPDICQIGRGYFKTLTLDK